MDLNLAKFIDHTLLLPTAKSQDFVKLCREALENQFFCVCVNSSRVAEVRSLLKNSSGVVANIQIASVVGFPHGANSVLATALETEQAIRDGATEIDMVNPIGALKERDYKKVFSAISSVVRAGQVPVKVILETGYLTFDEKIFACQIAMDAGAHFVKTCTGFATGSATIADVTLMRKIVGNHLGVKASGGIRDRQTAEAMIAAGATRLGTSSGVQIVKGSANATAITTY